MRIEGVPPYDIRGLERWLPPPGLCLLHRAGHRVRARKARLLGERPGCALRERQKSKSDNQDGIHGDAAFADYMILAAWSFRFGGEAPAEGEEHTGPEQPATTAPLRP